MSLRFTTLEENNLMKDVQSNLNPGPLQSPRYLIEFLLLSARVHPALLWRPLRNIAATLSTRCPADALEVSMATKMAPRDCEGQSEPINGTMLRDKKKRKQDKDQITNLCFLSLLFLLCQKCLCVFFYVCLFFLIYHCLLVYASLWWLFVVGV